MRYVIARKFRGSENTGTLRMITVSNMDRFLASVALFIFAGAAITGCAPAGNAPSAEHESPASAIVSASDAQQWVSDWQRLSADPIEWHECGEVQGAECAAMTVPLNWADPDVSTIELPLRRYPSPDEAAPILLILSGGPGGSGTQLVSDISDEFSDLQQEFTLVGFDPRGVWGPQGADHPLDCRLDAESCEVSDALSRYATSSDVAMDIESLRISLGGGPLHAVSYSYGTYVAGIYVTLFPESAMRIAFDGAAPAFGFTPLGTERQSIAFEDALDRFIDACLAGETGECPLSGDGNTAKEQLIGLRTHLDEAPIVISVDEEEVVLDGAGLRDRVLNELYRPRSSWESITVLLQSAFTAVSLPSPSHAANDQKADLATADPGDGIASNATDGSTSSVARGIAQAVMCAMPGATEPVSREDLEPLHSENYFFIEETGNAASDLSEALACAAALPAHLDPVISYDGPERFLVSSTTGDPATPYSDAATLADQLNAVLLAVEAEGHTSVFGQSSCASRAVMAYLTQGVLPADGTVCI